MTSARKRAAFGFFSGALVGATLMIVSSSGIVSAAKERYADLQLFTRVLNLVQEYYVEKVDTTALIRGGIRGMLRVLDAHTDYLTPELYKAFEKETSGEFAGLGVEITLQNDILTVISPIEDAPAWEAGIQAGDKIVEINGESTKGLSLAEAADRMRGKRGSKVRMTIFREGFEKPREFVISRGTVKIRSVKTTDLDDGYLYVRLTSFIEHSSEDVEKALKEEKKKHQSLRGVILDLRRNPGGLLDQAVKVADLFLEDGVIVSTRGRDKNEKNEVISARKPGTWMGFPIVILVNEASASASEIVAGAMQDHRRALIMGTRTFGKGSVQSVLKLGDGSALKLTVARYYTPSGRSIQAEGIEPDIQVEEVDSDVYRRAVVKHDVRREQDLSHHLTNEKEPPTKDKTDDKETDSFWYRQDITKRAALSPKDKLLQEDFQVSQAFNQLKAWKVWEKFSTKRGAEQKSPDSVTKEKGAPPEAAQPPVSPSADTP